MSKFNPGAGLNTFSTGASTLGSQGFGALGSALGTVGKLAGALNNLSNPSQLISNLRSINLPAGGNAMGQIASAGAQWSGREGDNDWRVRLSLPTTEIFSGSPVLQPLRNAGGMIFPYTPGINISSSAGYEETSITHQNYSFLNYNNSKQDQITITAPFHVEDAVQAQYWLAAVHFFRSLTKMFTGDLGAAAGNPPPIVLLNGYGDYVFKNIPVVVKNFSIELPTDVNYIATTVGKSFASSGFFGPVGQPKSPWSIGRTSAGLAGLAGALGNAQVAQIAGGIALGAGVLGALQNAKNSNSFTNNPFTGGSVGGASHVPVKSSMTVQLMPIYSRESMRKFNLSDFVNGKYVNNKVGYL
jgi:hypothetical protein